MGREGGGWMDDKHKSVNTEYYHDQKEEGLTPEEEYLGEMKETKAMTATAKIKARKKRFRAFLPNFLRGRWSRRGSDESALAVAP